MVKPIHVFTHMHTYVQYTRTLMPRVCFKVNICKEVTKGGHRRHDPGWELIIVSMLGALLCPCMSLKASITEENKTDQ